MSRASVFMTLRSRREHRVGSRAGWPVNANWARYDGRRRGVYIRIGTRAVLAGWWPDTSCARCGRVRHRDGWKGCPSYVPPAPWWMRVINRLFRP